MRKSLLAGLLLAPCLAWAQTTTYTITIPPITITTQTTGGTPPVVAPPVVTPPVVTPPVVTPPGPAAVTYDTTTVPGVSIPTNLADPCKGQTGKWATLTVHATDSIARALLCAAPNFHLTLAAGDYHQSFLVGAGFADWDIGGESAATVKLHKLGCTTANNNGFATCPDERLAWGKGLIIVAGAGSGTVHDLELADAGSANVGQHDLQAGLYVDQGTTGTITAKHVMFRNNQNGMASNLAALTMDLVIEESDFVGNGTDGGSHSTYLGGGKSVTYKNIHDYGSRFGNDQKSRIPIVHSFDGFYLSNQGRWLEAADGAVMDIHGGVFVGNTCCQNMFGNGTESTSKGPGNTTWDGSTLWIGRNSNLTNAGTFQATNITLTCGQGGFIFNSAGKPLTGMPACAAPTVAPPAAPPYISGAK